MTRSARTFLLLVLAAWVLGGCSEARYGIPSLKMRYDTPVERRATLSILRRTWEERPRKVSAEANLYERGLINRAAFFGRKINGTETYRAACDFWMKCVKEHVARYEDDAHHFRK